MRLSGNPENPRLIEVNHPSQWGHPVLAPDGEMRVPIVLGATYEYTVPMELPKLWWPAATDATKFTVTTIRGKNTDVLSCDGDLSGHIWGRDVSVVDVDRAQFRDTSNGGAGHGTVLFDLVGHPASIGFLLAELWSVSFFKQIAACVDIGVIPKIPAAYLANDIGFVMRTTTGVAPSTVVFGGQIQYLPSDLAPNSAFLTFIGTGRAVHATTCSLRLNRDDASFLLVDSASPGTYNVSDNHYESGVNQGEFFRPDVSLTVTEQSDASIPITSFDDSTVAPGVQTTANIGAYMGVTRGEQVFISGSGSYDGLRIVARVAADQLSFDIPVAHSTSTGGTLGMTEHTTSTAVNVVAGETVTVTGTTNYDGTVSVSRRTDATITLPQEFLGDDAAGTISSAGKDETSLGVICRSNVSQADSATAGEACWNANLSPTIVQDGAVGGVYLPWVLSGVSFEGQRVTISDPVTGEMTYQGESPATLSFSINIEGVKASGGTTRYRVNVAINGAIPVFADGGYSSLALRTAAVGVRTLLVRTAMMEPGDTIIPVIIGDGTTTTLAITEGQIVLRADS